MVEEKPEHQDDTTKKRKRKFKWKNKCKQWKNVSVGYEKEGINSER